jgi:hypothetical protein
MIAIPTKDEIWDAREKMEDEDIFDRVYSGGPLNYLLAAWIGAGWHQDEVICGILVGLQIAEDRKLKRPPLTGEIHMCLNEPVNKDGEIGIYEPDNDQPTADKPLSAYQSQLKGKKKRKKA